jgi:asparagine synthase (glutamine-hydrolysing)
MIDTISHRGPDDTATWSNGNGIFLGHRRLSVIDLSIRGRQPMTDSSGNTCIIHNGEIYNYIELRNQLKSEGFQFKSDSDTEVILHLYKKYNSKCVKHLRGMFAFGLWDKSEKKLMLARDRVGKKPMYYMNFDNSFYFASEIKALKAVLHKSSMDIDYEALDEYLSFGFISGEKTIYKNIREVPPGCLLTLDSPNNLRIEKYWEPTWIPKNNTHFATTVEETEKLLTEAVSIRLRADVPVGIFLSGGIDSCLITAIAQKIQNSPCITFSVGFEDDKYDERPLARTVADQYGTEHHEILIKPDIVSVLPKIVRAYDEPFADASAIPSYYIAQYASRHVKVVLNGDGGDELFAGYRRHIATVILEKLKRLYLGNAFKSFSNNVLKVLPIPMSQRTTYAFLHRFLRGIAKNSEERYLAWFSEGFNTFEKKELYKTTPSVDFGIKEMKAILQDLNGLEELDRIIALDFKWVLPFDLLVKMDIATMAHGLEARSPFLDQELVQWANRLPLNVKLPRFTSKPILRKLAKRYLPDEIVNAPKKGFEIPLYKWLSNDLKELSADSILSPNSILQDLFHKDYLTKLIFRKTSMEPGRWSVLVWTLLMLSLWERYCHKSHN